MQAVLVGAAVLLAGYLGLTLGLQRTLLYPSPRVPHAPRLPAHVEPVDLDGVEAWFVPASGRTDAPALLFAHGNGELIDHWLPVFDVPARWGVSVLLVEYPGYGRSAGRPSEASILGAMESAFDWLSGRPDVDASRVVGYGRSLGGGAVCALSRTRERAALILESTFTSVRSMSPRFLVPGFLVLDRFENREAVARFQRPVMVLHGERDTVIPPEHGAELAREAGVSLVRLPCGHNDCPRPWAHVERFLREHDFLR